MQWQPFGTDTDASNKAQSFALQKSVTNSAYQAKALTATHNQTLRPARRSAGRAHSKSG
ncbi:hypothetical protein PSEUDO8Z_150168 [Pseudomonas sp. 8Z]|nr:hypothetical protein PSEUDO8Z_150168 [Pseudomonas sp. 8Z]